MDPHEETRNKTLTFFYPSQWPCGVDLFRYDWGVDIAQIRGGSVSSHSWFGPGPQLWATGV